MTTTTLNQSSQWDFNNLALMAKDVVASGKLISQGTLVVDGNATITGTLTSASAAPKVVTVSAATAAPTASQTGTLFILARLAGSTVTLPAPVVGTRYTFMVGVVNTTVAYKVITDAGTTFLTGGVYVDKALTVTRYAGNGSTHVSFNMNGTTTGGLTIGDYIVMTCVTSTLWTVEGTYTASGTLATPFGTS